MKKTLSLWMVLVMLSGTIGALGVIPPLSVAAETGYILDLDFSQFPDGTRMADVIAAYPQLNFVSFDTASSAGMYDTAYSGTVRLEIRDGMLEVSSHAGTTKASSPALGRINLVDPVTSLPAPLPAGKKYYTQVEWVAVNTKQVQYMLHAQKQYSHDFPTADGTSTFTVRGDTLLTAEAAAATHSTISANGYNNSSSTSSMAFTPSFAKTANGTYTIRNLIDIDDKHFDGMWTGTGGNGLTQISLASTGEPQIPYRYNSMNYATENDPPLLYGFSLFARSGSMDTTAGEVMYRLKRFRIWEDAETEESSVISEIGGYPEFYIDNELNQVLGIPKGTNAAEIFDNAVIAPSAEIKLLSASGKEISGEDIAKTYIFGDEKIVVTGAGGTREYTLQTVKNDKYNYDFNQALLKSEIDPTKLPTSANRSSGGAGLITPVFKGSIPTFGQFFAASVASPGANDAAYWAGGYAGLKTSNRSGLVAVENVNVNGGAQRAANGGIPIENVTTEPGNQKIYAFHIDVRPGANANTRALILGGNQNSGDDSNDSGIRNSVLFGISFNNKAGGESGIIETTFGGRSESLASSTGKMFYPNNWYSVTFMVDIAAKEASVFVNGELVRGNVDISSVINNWRVSEEGEEVKIHADLNPNRMSFSLEQLNASGVIESYSYFDNISVYEILSPINVYPGSAFKPVAVGIKAAFDNAGGFMRVSDDYTVQQLLSAVAGSVPQGWTAAVYNNKETDILDSNASLLADGAPNKLIFIKNDIVASYCIVPPIEVKEPNYLFNIDFSVFPDGTTWNEARETYPQLPVFTEDAEEGSVTAVKNGVMEIYNGNTAKTTTASVPGTISFPYNLSGGKYYIEMGFELGKKQFQYTLNAHMGYAADSGGSGRQMSCINFDGSGSFGLVYAGSTSVQPTGISPLIAKKPGNAYTIRQLVNIDERRFDGWWINTNNQGFEQITFTPDNNSNGTSFKYRYSGMQNTSAALPQMSYMGISAGSSGSVEANALLYKLSYFRIWQDDVINADNEILAINYKGASADNTANKIHGVKTGTLAADIFDNMDIDASASKALFNVQDKNITAQKDSYRLIGGEKIKVYDAAGNARVYTITVQSDLFSFDFHRSKTKDELEEGDLFTATNRPGTGVDLFIAKTYPYEGSFSWPQGHAVSTNRGTSYLSADMVGMKTTRSAVFIADDAVVESSSNRLAGSLVGIPSVQMSDGKKTYVMSTDVRPGAGTRTIAALLGGDQNSGDEGNGGGNWLVGVVFDNEDGGAKGVIKTKSGAASRSLSEALTGIEFYPNNWYTVTLAADIAAETASVFVNGEQVGGIIDISGVIEKWYKTTHTTFDPEKLGIRIEQGILSGQKSVTSYTYIDNVRVFESDAPVHVYPGVAYKPLIDDAMGAQVRNAAGSIKLDDEGMEYTVQDLLDAIKNLPAGWIAGIYDNAESTELSGTDSLYTAVVPNKLIFIKDDIVLSYCIMGPVDYEFTNALGESDLLSTGINKVKLISTEAASGTFIIALYNKGVLDTVDLCDITPGMTDAERTLQCNIPANGNLADYRLKCFVIQMNTLKPLIGAFEK